MSQIKCYSYKQIEDSYMTLLSNMILSINHIGGDVSKLVEKQNFSAYTMVYNAFNCFKEDNDEQLKEQLGAIIKKFFGSSVLENASKVRLTGGKSSLDYMLTRNCAGAQLDLAALDMLGWDGFYDLVKQGSIYASFVGSQRRFCGAIDKWTYTGPEAFVGEFYGSLIKRNNYRNLKDFYTFKNAAGIMLTGMSRSSGASNLGFESLGIFESACRYIGRTLPDHRDVKFEDHTLVAWSASAKKGGYRKYYHCYDLEKTNCHNRYDVTNWKLTLENEEYVLPYIYNGKKRSVLANLKRDDQENFVGMVLETLPFYDGTDPSNKIVKVASVVTGDRFYVPTKYLKYAKNM